jgi:tetratricopeptide (TPR) repeat protein
LSTESIPEEVPPWGKSGFATILVRPDDEPGEPVDPIRYAVALEEAGRLKEAEAIYRQRLTARPDSALIWVNLGNVQMAQGFQQEAEEAYRTALDLDPDQRDALNNLAWLLLESDGDLDEAKKLAKRAVSVEWPDSYLALETLGRIHLEMGDCEAADEVFRSALETAPSSSSAQSWILYGLALSQRDCGDLETAIDTLEQVLLESPDPDLSEIARSALQALQSQ